MEEENSERANKLILAGYLPFEGMVSLGTVSVKNSEAWFEHPSSMTQSCQSPAVFAYCAEHSPLQISSHPLSSSLWALDGWSGLHEPIL